MTSPKHEEILPENKPKSRRGFKIVVGSLILLFVVVGMVATLLVYRNSLDMRGRASYLGPVLSMIPAIAEARVGDEKKVQIFLNTNDDTVSAADLFFEYDPLLIEIVGFENAESMPLTLSGLSGGNGQSRVAVGVAPESHLKGARAVGVIRLKIIGEGGGDLRFAEKTVIAAIGKNNNVLVSALGMKITSGSGITEKAGSPAVTLAVTPNVINEPPIIISDSLPVGRIFQSYSVEVVAIDSDSNSNLEMNIDGLPFGMYKENCVEAPEGGRITCRISGIPIKTDEYPIAVHVLDGFGGSSNKELKLTIR